MINFLLHYRLNLSERMFSVPKDGREALANIFSVRMGIRMDPCKIQVLFPLAPE